MPSRLPAWVLSFLLVLAALAPAAAQTGTPAATDPPAEPTVAASATPTPEPSATPEPTATAAPPQAPAAPPAATPAPTAPPTATATTPPAPTPTAAARAPSPRPTSTPTLTPTPAPELSAPAALAPAAPRIAFTPASGPPNTAVRVTLSGFPAGAALAVQFDGSTRARLTANSAGGGTASFRIPAAVRGRQQVRAVAGTFAAGGTFTVVPGLALSPTQGLAGQRVAVTLRGYGYGERVSLRFYTGAAYQVLATATADATSGATASVAVPRTASPGAHRVLGRGAQSAEQTFTVLVLSASVTVDCYGNPERATVRNTGTAPFTVTAVGSLHQPRSNEPFAVSRPLSPGASVTFQSGAAAASNVLTRQYIYDNNVGAAEGVRITTTGGTFADRCG